MRVRIGSLVKHIEYEYIGIITKQDPTCDLWRIHWSDNDGYEWYSECELEVLCK